MVINTIDTKDISVVVQGAIDKEYTPLCLKSIRKYLPESEIILSTWEGSEVDNLDYDVLGLSEDPKAKMNNTVLNLYNNCNRQLVSTQKGLEKANKKYALKLRTDALLINNSFLEYFDKFPSRNEKYKIFTNRVIVSSIYSREFSEETNLSMSFHPSDIYFFGLSEDIKDYFMKTKLLKDIELAKYFFKYNNLIGYANNSWKMSPEQYLCSSWLKNKFSDIQFDDWTDFNCINYAKGINILYNNFIFLDLKQSGIHNQKHISVNENSNGIEGLITFDRFKQRYEELCVNEKDYNYNIDEFSFLANNIIGYIETRKNQIIEYINYKFIESNCYKFNIFDIIANFIFSIEYSERETTITIFGFKLHLLHYNKERKGKERKGKERKGKERKGKERKGKEQPNKLYIFDLLLSS